MLTQAPKGTLDVYPRESHRYQVVEAHMRRICGLAGYREVRTPVFEHTELFLRGVGDTTDVVQKEMYTFLDKGGRSITLKPEGTAGAVRAFLEGRLNTGPLPVKMYYLNCPVFRYDKPQAGRYREHHQFGVEVLGGKDASADAEIIRLALDVIEAAGVTGLRLAINSIGCPTCRQTYFEALKQYLAPKVPELCETCRGRFDRNPMRILDCKVPSCQERIQDAPKTIDYLCDECSEHFASLKVNLDALSIEYEIDPLIVRGLDYYTKTVFEIITQTENGPLTVCGGGRYDELVETLGGPKMPGCGFGMGIERLIMVKEARGIAEPEPPIYDMFVATLGQEARIEGAKCVRALREAGYKADLDHAARSLKAQFKYADKLGAKYVLILADDELKGNVLKIRNMQTASETTVPRDELIKYFLGNR